MNFSFDLKSQDWLDKTYIVDWACAFGLQALSFYIDSFPVFERPIHLDDDLISHPHVNKQRITGAVNFMLNFYGSSIFIIICGLLYMHSLHDVHHGVLGLWSARGFSRVIVEFLKSRVGRLRPDFLARCQWDQSLQACSGAAELVLDGRRSFPSGHSATAWCAMMYLSLYINGKIGIWNTSFSGASGRLSDSKVARLCLVCAPLMFALWVAVSRMEDWRHHKEDVIVGSLIGLCSAITFYAVYWPLPHDRDPEAPKYVYSANPFHPTYAAEFALADMEAGESNH